VSNSCTSHTHTHSAGTQQVFKLHTCAAGLPEQRLPGGKEEDSHPNRNWLSTPKEIKQPKKIHGRQIRGLDPA